MHPLTYPPTYHKHNTGLMSPGWHEYLHPIHTVRGLVSQGRTFLFGKFTLKYDHETSMLSFSCKTGFQNDVKTYMVIFFFHLVTHIHHGLPPLQPAKRVRKVAAKKPEVQDVAGEEAGDLVVFG